jgi:predicted transposase/invertase (TIGR01784 family)
MLNQEWNTQTYGDVRFSEGIQQGILQGVQQGILQGAEQRSYETARALFELNLPLDQIAKATKISLDKLREFLQNDN